MSFVYQKVAKKTIKKATQSTSDSKKRAGSKKKVNTNVKKNVKEKRCTLARVFM